MHLPDGFLDLPTAGAAAALSLSGLWAALRRLRAGLPRRRIPLMGLAAAFLFVAQMLNFPVAGGTSGHLLGAVLAAVLLGPSAAIVVMTAVLLVQCLLFADGGVLALGANVFNMGIAAVLGGYAVFRGLQRLVPGRRGLLLATGFASWCSTILAALCCAGELAGSGIVAPGTVFPAMAGVHMVIGLGEGLITMLIIVAVERTRPDLVRLSLAPEGPGPRRFAVVQGLLVTAGLLLFVAPFASPWPDGLERVAAALGFEHRAAAHPLGSVALAEYQIPGLGSTTAGLWIAGLVGAVVAFGLALGAAVVLAPKAASAPRSSSGA